MIPQADANLFVLLHRQGGPSGRTRHFVFYTGEGHAQRANYVAADDVEPFAGAEAWYEVEFLGAQPWPTWRPVRPISPPSF